MFNFFFFCLSRLSSISSFCIIRVSFYRRIVKILELRYHKIVYYVLTNRRNVFAKQCFINLANTQNRDVRSPDDNTLRYRFQMKKEPRGSIILLSLFFLQSTTDIQKNKKDLRQANQRIVMIDMDHGSRLFITVSLHI